ncbi:helix-turn-helix domain-containing protein [Undibacterium sp. Di24W]|uniref:helix-turn-helix domain-containing protein n=1 Tax=Undibacterium sp. Di24W TaxID=3413033 RepID=UPI003BF23520
MTIAKRINIAMKLAGINTQADLARASGVPTSTLARILANESQPNPANLAAIANACGRSIDWIVNGTNIEDNSKPEVSLVYVTLEEMKVLTEYRESTDMGKSFIKIAAKNAEKQSLVRSPTDD